MRLFLYGGLVAAFVLLSFGINSGSDTETIVTTLLTEEDVVEIPSDNDDETTHENLPSPCIRVEDLLSRRTDNNDGGFRFSKAFLGDDTYTFCHFCSSVKLIIRIYHEDHSTSHDRVYQFANAPPAA